MKKILSYGDSFVAPYLYDTTLGWVQLLSKKINLSVVNKAVRASSAEFCMKNFYNDIEKNTIKNGDIVIISLANPGRVHFTFQDQFPESASFYSSSLINYQDINLPKNKWLKENKEHLEWYLVNVDLDLININHSCYVHAIKNYAENFPDITVILLSGWKLEKQFPLGILPPNFLYLKIPLMDISSQEIKDFSSYFYWVSDCIIDPRVNHFSNDNLEIFADLIFQSIKKLDISIITLDKFKKNIFPKKLTYDDYLRSVNNKDINYYNEVVNYFQKNNKTRY
jgi:hypothetical protein